MRGLKDQEQFKKTCFNNSKDPILKQLKRMLRIRLDELERTEADYTVNSWSHYQADRNGQRKQIKDLINILYFVED